MRKVSSRSVVTELDAASLEAEPISSTGERVRAGQGKSGQMVDPYIGRTIDGRYLVEALIGSGGMGVIYQCRHRIIGKKLAIKIIRREVARTPEVPQRFLIEARAASAIGSEHIIHVSDFGRLPDGAAYLVMEFLEGISLANAIESCSPMPIARVVAIGIQLAEGLGAAHQAGIVHRDLKPENIFLVRRHDDQDFVKILDFGVAQMSLDGARKLTRAGCIVGTPHYMSPEQAGGERVDPRGDIYSLGIILYELISGRVPFDGENYRAILSQHLLDEPAPFERVVPWLEVPSVLEQIVRRCLAKQPNERFGSMAELGSELRRFQDAGGGRGRNSFRPPASASPPGELETGTRAVARMSKPTLADGVGRGRLYAGAVALALMGALGGWIVVQSSRQTAVSAPAQQPAPSAPSPAPASSASSAGVAGDPIAPTSAAPAPVDDASRTSPLPPERQAERPALRSSVRAPAKAEAAARTKASSASARKKQRSVTPRETGTRTKKGSGFVDPWAPKR